MEHLIFRLYAPLASFGEVAVGEYRGSHLYPARSAVLGLLAAALGIDRHDDAAHAALAASCQVAVAMLSSGFLLRDYHTAQVPSASALKKRPHQTRADELAIAKEDLNTILSTRDYRQDAASLVGIVLRPDATSRWCLEGFRDALKKPHFTLYVGRKCCPLAMPLEPRVIEAASLMQAFSAYQGLELEQGNAAIAALPKHRQDSAHMRAHMEWLASQKMLRIAWEDGMRSGIDGEASSMTVLRKDQPLSRRRWQFADRQEHIAVLATEQSGKEAA